MDLNQLKINSYLTTYDIVENTTDYNYLVGYLNFIFSYLENKGLIFSTGQSQIIRRYTINTRQTIFPTPFFKENNLTKVSYFYDDIEEELIYLGDYIKKDFKSGYFKTIELLDTNKVFHLKSRLELTGIFGFDIIPEDLHFVLLEMFAVIFNDFKLNKTKLKNGGQDVSSTRIGNVSTTFRDSSTNFSLSNVVNSNKTFSNLINTYL
jgi:hypothetical protein